MTVCAWKIGDCVAMEVDSSFGIVSVSVRVSNVPCAILRAFCRLSVLMFLAARNHEALHQSSRPYSNQLLLELTKNFARSLTWFLYSYGNISPIEQRKSQMGQSSLPYPVFCSP